MINFRAILKTIGVDALKTLGIADQVSEIATPFIVPALSPQALAVEQAISKGINLAETAITGAQQGVAKKQTAGTIIAAEIPTLESIVAEFGPNVELSPDQISSMQGAIDGLVAVRNNIATMLASMQAKAATKSA
ncbi:MAG: hypothetical protein KGL39_33110 [Patescibacteria group bacterium]|nr:hypothetical protein [Patescibacteria group bacterium]